VTDHCAECGFTYDTSQAAAAGQAIRAQVADVVAILQSTDVNRWTRLRADVWSALEYGCHVRDVLLVQRERVLGARRVNGSGCTPMGREERVDHDGYADQRPGDVARQLSDAVLLFDNVLCRLATDDWDRTVIYNYPKPQERSLRWLAVHTAHEVQHHLLDIRRQL
jgi:DinB superfamily